jgi:sulfur-carrier protein
MTCSVRIPSPLRSYTAGAAQIRSQGSTLMEVLAGVERQCPGLRFRIVDEQDGIRPHMRMFINRAEAAQLSAPVAAGDVVHIVCALSGG